MYRPTTDQVTRARALDPATARRVRRTVMGVLGRPAWHAPAWRHMSDLVDCYLPCDTARTVMRALLPLVAAGALEARDTPHGPQVRRAPGV